MTQSTIDINNLTYSVLNIDLLSDYIKIYFWGNVSSF